MAIQKPPRIPQYGNGVIIYDWMVKIMHLQGDELVAYAVIHSFSKDGQSVFYGSIAYLSFWMGKTKPTVLKVLKSLLGHGLIAKEDVPYTGINPNRHYCRYWTTFSRLEAELQKKILTSSR